MASQDSRRPDGGKPSDEALAQASLCGDREAFELLVGRYLRPAMALAWQYTGRLEDAEDVVQDSFHRAVRALPEYDSARPFHSWFYAIVRNVGRTFGSKSRRRSALAPTTAIEEEPRAAPVADPVSRVELSRALAQLAPMQQASFRLCDVEGFTSGEAAKMLGITEGTVRTHLHRARAGMRRAVADSPRSASRARRAGKAQGRRGQPIGPDQAAACAKSKGD